MTVTHEQLDHLTTKLKGAIGDEATFTLMDYLPPGGWASVATKQDLEVQTALLRAADTELRAEMQSGFAELRAEMQSGFAELRAADSNLLAEIDRRFQRLLLQLGATTVAVVTLVFTVGFALGGR